MPSSTDQQRPLRVVHVFRATLGGLFRHVVDLAREQARAGWAVGLACDSLTGGARETAILEDIRAHLSLGLIRLPMSRAPGVGDLATVLRLAAPLRHARPDVLHGHGAKGGLYARLLGTWLGRDHAVARIYTPHGGSMHYDPRSLQGRIYFTVERQLGRATDALIHVSQFEADMFRAKVMAPRCIVAIVPNGLEAAEFVPVAADPEAADLLFLGEYRDLKGVDVLLSALARLRERSKLTLRLVGPGDQAPYREQALKLDLADRVAFCGAMPAREAFRRGRILIVPSRAESLPYVVLEAVAAAMPVIASRVGGIPEILPPEALVRPDDPDALAAAIDRVTSDPLQAAAEARERQEQLRQRFTVEAMQRSVAEVYRAALAANRRP
jgi:glycosyltransferase involved in cell wall biosynthesis